MKRFGADSKNLSATHGNLTPKRENFDQNAQNKVIYLYHNLYHKTHKTLQISVLTPINSDPVGTRTQNRLLRRQMLYPVELRDHENEGRKETGFPGTIRGQDRPKRSREQLGFDGGPAGVACDRELGGEARRKIGRTVEAVEVGHY